MLREPISLDMNEMPYPPSANIVRAAEKGVQSLHRYAERADLERLKNLLACYSGVPEEQVVVAPGSDLLLREIILSCARERKLVLVSPSFLPTVRTARQFATKLVRIRLSPPDFGLDPELLLEELKEPALAIIDNPNNPTGRLLLDRRTVKDALHHRETLLVVDEAYFEFCGVTFADLVAEHPNLAITRTMDKGFRLAGARVGYLIAGRRFLDRFSSFYAYLPQPSLHAAVEALASAEDMRDNIQLMREERDRLRTSATSLGVSVSDSSANFLLMQTRLPDIADRLRNMGILVSDVSSQLAPGSIRVSVGTHQENNAFIDGIKKILEVA